MKWIGKGVLRVAGKDISYGEDIPSKGISPERIAQLKKLGMIGEIPVLAQPATQEIKNLQAEINKLQKDKKAMAEAIKAHAKDNDVLRKANADLVAQLEAAKPDEPASKGGENK